MAENRLAQTFRGARGDRRLAVLEGFHPVKHALRFGARLRRVVSPDPRALAALARRLAPDVAAELEERVEAVTRELFARLAPRPPATGVLALADRPHLDVARAVEVPGPAPALLLERPAHLGNLGAAVRVAAAVGAAGVLVGGVHDPWHPDALRGSAGLHFALPVVAADGLPAGDRPLVAVDPAGERLDPATLPRRPLLAFGGERRGLSRGLLERADRVVRLPMREGVSSLNLATAVAAVSYVALYGRAGGRDERQG